MEPPLDTFRHNQSQLQPYRSRAEGIIYIYIYVDEKKGSPRGQNELEPRRKERSYTKIEKKLRVEEASNE